MRFTRHQLLALVLGAGMATVLPAQGRVGGGRGRQMDSVRTGRQADSVRARRVDRAQQMDTAQRAAMRERLAAASTPAGMILQMRERLGLTDDQVNRLETMKAAYVEPSQTELQKLREELATASRGEADLKAARAAMNRINEVTTNALIVRLDARNKARAVLNADQQVQFDAVDARRPAMGGLVGAGGAMGRGARGSGEPPAAGAVRRGGGGRGGAVRPPQTIPPPQQ